MGMKYLHSKDTNKYIIKIEFAKSISIKNFDPRSFPRSFTEINLGDSVISGNQNRLFYIMKIKFDLFRLRVLEDRMGSSF